MRPVALPQAERAREVARQHLLLFDGRKQRLINLLLVVRAILAHFLLLALALVEERLLTPLLVRLLVPREVLWLADLVDDGGVQAFHGDARLGGDHIAGVDAAEWHTVDLEWSSNEEDALVENFEEDNALAAETAGEEDEDFAGGEGGAGLVGANGFAGLGEC